MLLTNYHTHHDRCKHAKGDVEAYVKEAVKHNYAEIGMSCHATSKFPSDGNTSYGLL